MSPNYFSHLASHSSLESQQVMEEIIKKRIGAMALIFVVSLFAVTFPGMSRKIKILRIPHYVFFVGKHFGTGVILATAFCHLLQDAFTSLLDPEVQKHTNVARWTGLIILCSLLAIFLIEYISTSYVDRLNADPSSPTSPANSPSRPTSPVPPPIAVVLSQSRPLSPSERTPLLPSPLHSRSPSPNGVPIPGRQRSHSLHEPSSPYLPLIHSNNPRYVNILGDRDHHRCCCTHDEFCGTKRRERKHRHSHSHKNKIHTVHEIPPAKPSVVGIFVPAEYVNHESEDRTDEERGRSPERTPRPRDGGGHHHHDLNFLGDGDHTSPSPAPGGGRRRQVVGILVLQLGIMIHSLVIGLTLSITPKSDFTPLLTAIFFHQLFEGLSLGIRIASLPPPPSPNKDEHEHPSSSSHPHSHSSGGSILSATLSFLFAATTPAGILIGLISFGVGEGVHLRLTQGIMSAVSAGMLIYATCVEMLAGDFVMDPHMHMGPGGNKASAFRHVQQPATPPSPSNTTTTHSKAAPPSMPTSLLGGPQEAPAMPLQEANNNHAAGTLNRVTGIQYNYTNVNAILRRDGILDDAPIALLIVLVLFALLGLLTIFVAIKWR
ncbi:hypothetical protein ONZ45_g7669 [Pleurotus djamor]|nr:hypothetical protein ONZ45_g7669 [Pleurotus djamor]